MLKAATVFFKRLRVSYVVLIGVAILSKVRPETDLLLFALAFIFIGMSYLVLGVLSVAEMMGIEVNMVLFSFIFFMVTFPVDVLVDNICLVRKAEKKLYSKKRKVVR